jgi:hypothetical protein
VKLKGYLKMKEIVEDGVRDENKCMGDFSVILYFLWEKLLLKFML